MSNTDTATTAATTAAAAAAAAAATTPWHTGVEAETLGFWQNKGFKVDDPKALAGDLTKSYRELEKHFGVPADQLLKMPKADAKPEDIKAFRVRLGMPAEAKEYDFSTIKGSDGNPIADSLADTLRVSAHAAGLAKDAASTIAAAVQKHLDDKSAADTAVNTAKVAEEKVKLKANWKADFDFNQLKAMEGARRLGLSRDNPDDLAAIQALENTIGYARVMEIFRKVGQSTSEDTFVERGATGSGTPHTREGAVARKAELMADTAWGKRLTAGDVAAKAEWNALNAMIDGAA